MPKTVGKSNRLLRSDPRLEAGLKLKALKELEKKKEVERTGKRAKRVIPPTAQKRSGIPLRRWKIIVREKDNLETFLSLPMRLFVEASPAYRMVLIEAEKFLLENGGPTEDERNEMPFDDEEDELTLYFIDE